MPLFAHEIRHGAQARQIVRGIQRQPIVKREPLASEHFRCDGPQRGIGNGDVGVGHFNDLVLFGEQALDHGVLSCLGMCLGRGSGGFRERGKEQALSSESMAPVEYR